MGCSAAIGAPRRGELAWPEDARSHVLELQKMLEHHERENESLRQTLEATPRLERMTTGDSQAVELVPTGELSTCMQCNHEVRELFLDASDMNRYCDSCWTEFYGSPPICCAQLPLVQVEVYEVWTLEKLQLAWSQVALPGWVAPSASPVDLTADAGEDPRDWSHVRLRLRHGIVGPHARESQLGDKPHVGDIIGTKYKIRDVVGQGHFTKAFLADDVTTHSPVCLKCHRALAIEALGDLIVIGRRVEACDPCGNHFPRLLDAFYDLVGFTVETVLPGQDCLALTRADPRFFFNDLANLRVVARDTLKGLALLAKAGVVHNDVKPDNLIWTDQRPIALTSGAGDGDEGAGCGRVSPSVGGGGVRVRIVDFGCARLDISEERGRNWSFAEGGAGHLGKWSPEMVLRLPITHKNDVWGLAVSICELHCGRATWRSEADTSEVVLAQSLGLCGLADGLPLELLSRSMLDVTQLYTPGAAAGGTDEALGHRPVRRAAEGQLEALRPAWCGLAQVLGDHWELGHKLALGRLLSLMLVADPEERLSAQELLESGCAFLAEDADGAAPAV
eukprot:NODE_3761_length_1990_cov_5.369297.p1 GENE.NODE_3761_length_1990_cov_5.369297~~NODE_3761_length_1990_cov_5.369297.p1  ORF type:complete len:563 (-),score=157.14 NODE_3761_length_1990_cov_5.369297:138-1826(-)